MINASAAQASPGIRLGKKPGGIRHGLEAVAAAAGIGLIVLSAALPDRQRLALADEFAVRPPPFSATRENVFGAYLGAPYHYPSDFHLKREADQDIGLRDLTIHNVEWYTNPFENPLYYGARILHWQPGGRFGAMVDFTHSKAYAPSYGDYKFSGSVDGKPLPETAKVRDFFNMLSFSHGHNMLTLNGMLRLAKFGFIWPYVGAGGGISLPHTEIHLNTDPTRTYEYQYTGLNCQALFGFEFRLSTGSLFLEYKFTFANYEAPVTGIDGNWLPQDLWRQFTRWWSGESPPGGWGMTNLASHQVIGGFYVRFVPQLAKTP